MAARLDSVAKYICKKADWSLSHLQLQKILYLAQMIYMGRHNGQRLFNGTFEAWDLGPVEPNLYHRAKVFGSSPVNDIFFNARRFDHNDPRRSFLDSIAEKFVNYNAGDLVDLTHSDQGAWAIHYEPNRKGVRIPDCDIIAEYGRRLEGIQTESAAAST